MTDTNGLLRAPTNFWATNIIGDSVTVIPTNFNGGWGVILKSTGGSGDPGGTNARQFGSLNLTNWSNIPTGAMANVTAANFLTNWANAVSNYVTSATNSPSVTNWITTRQPASQYLSNFVTAANGTGMLTNGGSGTLGWMAIPSGGSGATTNANQFGVTANGQLSLKTGAFQTNANLIGAGTNTGTFYAPTFIASAVNPTIGFSGSTFGSQSGDFNMFAGGSRLWIGAGSDGTFYPTADGDYNLGASGQQWGLLYAYRGIVKTNTGEMLEIYATAAAKDAIITNSLYLAARNAGKLLRTDSATNVAEVTVGTGLSFDGTTLSASGSVITNANQFGETANGTLSIKTGALFTNVTVHGTAGAATTLGINANASGGGPLIRAKDTGGADVFVVQVDGTIQGNGPGGGPLLIGPTTSGFVLTADASGYGSWAAPSPSSAAAGNSGNIQFAQGANLAGTNDLNWDRTNLVLNMKGVLSSTLNAPPSNSLAYFTGSTNDYLQINVRNASSGTGAESGYAATADTGTELSGFAWMGINSSTFNAVRNYSIGAANDVTFIGSGNDMEFANANTNRDMIWSMGTAGTPFWQERMRLKSTTQGGALGLTAGLSTSNAWVAGKIIEVRGLAFTNNAILVTALTNAYTNATLIAANMLTNQGDSIICEWTIAHKALNTETNTYQVVYGSQIIFNSGLTTYSNGMSIVRQRITRGTSGTQQDCEGEVVPFVAPVSAIGATNLFTASQSNWIATPIGLRFASGRPHGITNTAFRMYYEPATR